METFFKVGDRVKLTGKGQEDSRYNLGTVVAIDDDFTYSVRVVFDGFTYNIGFTSDGYEFVERTTEGATRIVHCVDIKEPISVQPEEAIKLIQDNDRENDQRDKEPFSKKPSAKEFIEAIRYASSINTDYNDEAKNIAIIVNALSKELLRFL